MVAEDGNFYFRKTPLGTGFSACNCLFDSRNCLLTSLKLGSYYKLNWPKRVPAVYWLLGTLLYPWQGQSPQMGEFLQASSTVPSTRREEVSEDISGARVHSMMKVEEDFEDRVTQDMCSTSVSTDSRPQMMKMERARDVRKEKLRLFVQCGRKKFQVSLEGHKKVKRVRMAVAGQLQVATHRVELQVIWSIILIEIHLT